MSAKGMTCSPSNWKPSMPKYRHICLVAGKGAGASELLASHLRCLETTGKILPTFSLIASCQFHRLTGNSCLGVGQLPSSMDVACRPGMGTSLDKAYHFGREELLGTLEE